jgi:hypothetical protein
MISNMKDFAIFVLVVYIFSLMVWVRLYPEQIGQWQARMDISYDQIWGEYVADCDCTEEFQ